MRKVDAEITAKHRVSADISLNIGSVSADVRLPTVIREKDAEKYEGDTEITPSWEDQVLETADKYVEENITVLSIKTYEVSNDAGGITLSI